MAMDHIRGPNVLDDFDRYAAELAVTLGIVWKISGTIAVKTVAIEISRVVDKKIPNARNLCTVHDGGKSQSIRHRNS